MQKRNALKEELTECGKSYHQCLRELNRLLKETNDRGDERNAASTRNKFNQNFWKFKKNLLDDESVETTQLSQRKKLIAILLIIPSCFHRSSMVCEIPRSRCSVQHY